MEDKELLELAAKSVGLHVKVASNSGRGLKVHGNCNWWNPLTDDGDALRLAVSLRLQVINDGFMAVARTGNPHKHGAQESLAAGELHATRRAITMVAAQIGKGVE